MVQIPTFNSSEQECLLTYAAYKDLDSGCFNPFGGCVGCKVRRKCDLHFIHDAVLGKCGTNHDDWNKLKEWANTFRATHQDLIAVKF